MRKLVIKDEKVINIINANDDFTLDGMLILDYVDGVDIGDLYKNGEFSKDLIAIEAERRKILTIEAKALLEKSDMVALRCWKAGIQFPQSWIDYVSALRLVINGEGEIPETPNYPEGS